VRALIVGDIVKLKQDVLGNDAGALGCVYEIYEEGASIIFENGEYDGFSSEEQLMFVSRVGHEKSLENYKFKNVMQLSMDFDNGIFEDAFN
jgi:hypothetical protein